MKEAMEMRKWIIINFLKGIRLRAYKKPFQRFSERVSRTWPGSGIFKITKAA